MKTDFLKGIRFADLTWAGAGPFGTKLFSDFGAEVIKVESAVRPDPVRIGGPFKDGEAGINRSGYFASRNSGKKSMSVDLKSEAGRKIVHELIEQSDVIANNFGAGAMDRLGMSYETVKAIKPDIIYLSMPMYGESGPRASLRGLGMTISAVSGLLWQTAYDDKEPIGPGTHFPDHAANPYHAAFAIMAALRYRKLTGKGMNIQLAQVESMINFVGADFMEFAISGNEPRQIGNRSTSAAPHDIYQCAGDDTWCAIAVETEEQWQRFAIAVGSPNLAAFEIFSDVSARLQHREELDSIITRWTKKHDAVELADLLQAAGIPAAAVANSQYLIEKDPQLAARNYWQRVDHPELGNSLYASPPYNIDGERVALLRPPLLGEHTAEVLSDLLNLPDDQIAKLESAGVLK